MKILRAYFIKEFFKYFFLVLLIVISISTVVEFFDRVEQFYHGDASAFLIISYLSLRVPSVILYTLPFASLLSILMTIGVASKWRETIVIKASGCSIKSFFSCFLTLGFAISFFALVFGETVVPIATKEAMFIRQVKIMKRSPKITFRDQELWLKGTEGSLIRIDGFIGDKNKILKTSVFSFDSFFGFKKRIEADEGEWTDGAWRLKNAKVFDFKTNRVITHESLILTSLEEPKIFSEERKKPIEMNFLELYEYDSRLEKAGFKNLKHEVRLYEKLAYPTINFVMILFGIALALNSKWGGGVKAAGFGILISVFYWLLYTISISLGIAGVLKPWIAPFISPILFGIAGTVMFWRIKE